jgi:hypothetical protein
MRKKYSHSELSKSQIDLLEELPGWSWDPLETAWNEMFSLVREFSEAQGLKNLEKRSTYKGKKVGQWIGVQRRARSTMSERRKARLESLSGWSWDPKEDFWKENFELLSRLANDQGVQSIKSDEVIDGIKIGQWIGVQRRQRESISVARRNALEALPGWSWSPLQEKRMRVIQALREFYVTNGHLEIPANMQVDDINLYAYAARLRRSRDKLEPSEREALEAIDAWSWS